MALKMIEPCKDCPELKNCTKPCDRLEKFLPDDIKIKERTASDFLREEEDEENRNDDVPDIDKLRKIDPGALYQEVEDLDIEWDSRPLITSDGLTDEKKEIHKRHIDKAIPYGQTKLRRRFYSFLRCDDIAAIAIRANTSKQNIQQMFQRIIQRIVEMREKKNRPLTPLKFKAEIPEWR
jgi:hypothetical protein